jgi:hypothetical protein
MKKHTLEYIKNYIENKGYILHSDYSDYKNSYSKLILECSYKHVYKISFSNFKKRKCPVCNPKSLPFNHVKSTIEAVDGYKLLSTIYINARTKLEIECNKGHIYNTTIQHFKEGSRCIKCQYVIVGIKQRHSYEYIKDFIEEIGYKLLSKDYINSKTKLEIQCDNNHTYQSKFTHFNAGSRCPHCNTYHSENLTRKLFEEIFNQPFPKTRPKDLKNPKTNYSLELDGYNDNLKIAFEYQGEQHYQLIPFFHKSQQDFQDQQYRDKLTQDYCLANNINLLIIPYQYSYQNEHKLREFIQQLTLPLLK